MDSSQSTAVVSGQSLAESVSAHTWICRTLKKAGLKETIERRIVQVRFQCLQCIEVKTNETCESRNDPARELPTFFSELMERRGNKASIMETLGVFSIGGKLSPLVAADAMYVARRPIVVIKQLVEVSKLQMCLRRGLRRLESSCNQLIELRPLSASKLVATVTRVGFGSWAIARGIQHENFSVATGN